MIRDAQSFQALLANAGHMTLEEFAETFDEKQKEEKADGNDPPNTGHGHQ